MLSCVDCSASLARDKKFCTSCGNPVSCPKCGKARGPGNRFCVHDGHRFVLRTQPAGSVAGPAAAPACAACGTAWKAGAKFCVRCGAVPPRPSPWRRIRLPSRNAAVAATALAVLLIAVIIPGKPAGPTPTEAAYGAGNLAFSNKDYDAAIAQYSRALELTPAYKAAALKRGMARLALERVDEARADYDLALSLDPSYADAYFARGTLHWILGESSAAADDYGRAVELSPDERFYYDRLATALYEAKRDGEVVGLYENAYSADRRRDWALWGWLGALFAKDRIDGLRGVCARLESEGVVSAAIFYHQGLVAWKGERWSSAVQRLERALAEAPEQMPLFGYRVLWQSYRKLGEDSGIRKYAAILKEKTGKEPEDGQ